MRNLSNWRAVRVLELDIERQVKRQNTLWLHGVCIGLIVLAVMWASAHVQSRLFESGSLALRYLLTLGMGYLAYLLIVRMWAGALLRHERGPGDLVNLDVPSPDLSGLGANAPIELPPMTSGGGGDFAGGGASGDFGDAGSAIGEFAGDALGVAASSDEGAIVVVPVVAIFLIGVAVLLGTGSLLLLYFGWDVLLAVAVELGFGYVAARTATRIRREGWLLAAVRLTWKPLLGALMAAVLLGGTIDYFIPSAHTLPGVVKAIVARPAR